MRKGGKYIIKVSKPTNWTHLSRQIWISFLNIWFLSDKLGIKFIAIFFDHCLKWCFNASINWPNKFIIILTIFLFPSVNFFFIKFINSFKPLGNIFILASFNNFSICSHASFFSAHFPSDIFFKSCGVIFLDISDIIFCLISFLAPPFNPFSPPFTLFFESKISEGLLLFELFCLVFIEFLLSITVIFDISFSMFFNVDSLISFINLRTSSP